MARKGPLLATIALAAAFTAANINDVQAQTANNNSKPKTETSSEIMPGSFADADNVSLYGETPPFVLHVSGGQDPKYNAEKYAKMFSHLLKQKAPDIKHKVLHEESGKDRPTLIVPVIDGFEFDESKREPSEKAYTPEAMLASIDNALNDYRREVLGEPVAGTTIASLER